MSEQYTASPCPCGHRACQDWHVWPVAAVQGVGFTQQQAEAVAKLLNEMETTKLVVSNILALDAVISEAHGRYENARDDNQNTKPFEEALDFLVTINAAGEYKITNADVAHIIADCIENMQDSQPAAYGFSAGEADDFDPYGISIQVIKGG